MTALMEPAAAAVLSSGDWYEPVSSKTGRAPTPSVFQPQQAPWIYKATERLAHLVRLGTKWDGHGSVAVDPDFARVVLKFLARPMWRRLPSPHIVPTVNGGLAIEWTKGALRLELEIDPTGTFEAYGGDADTTEEWEGDVATVAERVIDWIARLARDE